MANDNLKNALHHAGLTPEQFADIVRVDPKTVQRWIAGSNTPYAKHRATIARALDLTEHELWPAKVPAPEADPYQQQRSAAGEVTGSWARGSDPTAPDPVTFLAQTAQPIDVLDEGGALLLLPGLLDALRDRALDAGKVRVLTVTPPDELGALIGHEGVELRLSTAPSGPALVRAGDQMLLSIPLAAAGSPPVLQLTRQSHDGLFDRLAEHFQALWDQADILTERLLEANGTPASRRDTSAGTGPLDERPGPASASGETAPRRWPGSRTEPAS